VDVTESQVALYGGALWVGPLFLAGYVLLYLWLSEGPLTRRGRRRVAQRHAYRGVVDAIRREERERGFTPRAISVYLPARVIRRARIEPDEVDGWVAEAVRVMERPDGDPATGS
jgi:hypothetical protein